MLSSLGHDVDTTFAEQLTGKPDSEVWNGTQLAERFLVTQDLDFSDMRKFEPGTHHGILLLRLRHPSRVRLTRRVLQIFRTEDVENWRGCFVTATDHKVRVRRV